MQGTRYHTPVLAKETLSYLITAEDGTYVDCTLGGGGHTEAVLEQLRGGRVIGFDRDEEAMEAARKRLHGYDNVFDAVHAPFGELQSRLRERSIDAVHGILLDLGVSSHHLDEPSRGFSFQENGPLDMRMDRRSGKNAADVVNTYSEKDLSSVLMNYGEEREANRITRAIVQQRPITMTSELADIVRSLIKGPQATKALARVFQAIRIEVNDELQQLHAALQAIPAVLMVGGRVVVLTYHSLEDRIVKEFFRKHAQEHDPSVSRFLPERTLTPDLRILTRRPVRASDKEAQENPRARSAKLRAAERI